MSDFLSRLTVEDAPEAREVSLHGETGTVWFRRLSAAEQQALLKGMKITHTPGKGQAIDLDLFQNEEQRHLLVFFSVCDEKGKRLFKSLDEVKNLNGYKVKALAWHAQQVNRDLEEEDGPGKA